ncbi:MAG: GlsB/YeaQ/YmgE family stress response membrane protein [Deltaproteobacteria bacterium]|nr:GlsB/YeaQ/YmgE family stress response membrane protein [Deltaproteobacteria bacterium]
MGIMDIVTWLVVGLVAGVLAGLVVGGYGLLADIVVGIVGAFIGGALFAHMGWHAPFVGLAGTIFVAFIGALILLVVLHLIHSATYRRRALY